MPWPLTECRCPGCIRLEAACICGSTRRADQTRALNHRLPRGTSGTSSSTGGERRSARKPKSPSLGELLFGKPKPKRRRRR
jgi:hypothetical protein